MKKQFIQFFIFLFSFNVLAQNYVPSELLIKLKENETTKNFLLNLKKIGLENEGIRLKQEVSPVFDIILIEFDRVNYTEKQLIQLLKKGNLVEEAQVNHILENRATTPNDLSYTSQWQYKNTGQSGGTPGADIDIEDAWDETTGGLTSDGDTIVVCVIDGGFDISHQDLAPNMWKNHAEIPNNGIDDDLNGYVDDYRGWNAYSNSDNILPNNGHGTPVAAIVGAKGNDSLGVAGVNWDVKLMCVSGGGNEAQALAAYTYPYLARKKYNETNGAQGAFVVATNASWGVNYGQAADAPLWCAFYDSLGTVGVLNAGATANLNVNVDTDGDLPTQCSSDYLITVTNMNDNDVKVNSAGYGTTTIDLGAFGQGTYTAMPNNTYGGFGGTSGATPHVAGVIALLYSADCNSLIQISKQNPALAASMVKSYILDGVEANSSLANITTTEGRLNVKNSMNLLLDECSTCPSVQNINLDSIVKNGAFISWGDTSNTNLNSHIIYQKNGASIWDTIQNVSSPYTLQNLDLCSDYKIKVIKTCPDTSFSNSATLNASIEECCYLENLSSGTPTSEEVSISWSSTPGVLKYKVYYKKIDEVNWTDSVELTNSTSYTLSNLELCQKYEINVLSECETLAQSNSIIIKTKGCGACEDIDYCTPVKFTNTYNYINRVKLNSFSNYSSDDEDGYGNYVEEQTLDLVKGTEYTLKVRVENYPNNFNLYVWLDFNADGNLDATERFVHTDLNGKNYEFKITPPNTAIAGPTRMRLVFRYGNSSDACPTSGTPFGEIEDYCFNVVNQINVEDITLKEPSIYPNPVENVLKINNVENTDIIIRDALGKEILKVKSLDNLYSLDVQDLQTGIYLIEFYVKDRKISTKKIIKK